MKKVVKKGLLTGLALLLGAQLGTSVEAASKTKIVVATDSDTAPFTYKKDNKFRGYDIDVVKAIFKGSKEYEVSFETVAFSSILVGVDADRYQIAANNFNYNKERAEKYIFSDPISRSNYAITSADGVEYDSLDDLSGKSTEALPGSNYAQILEDWNKAHADKKPIKINYVAGNTGITSRLQNIEKGKIDFILYDAISAEHIVKDQGLDLEVTDVEEEVGSKKDGLEYLLFAKTDDGKELATFVNKRLKKLKKDGTLKKLSKKHFGGDYVSNID